MVSHVYHTNTMAKQSDFLTENQGKSDIYSWIQKPFLLLYASG